MDLMSLVARLSLDSSEYESGVSSAKLGMLAVMESASKTGSSIVSAMEGAAGKVVDFGKSIWDAASKASVFADDILTLATQTGLSATQLQEFGYASRFVDTEVSTITGSITKMQKNMASDSKDAAEAFSTLGVKVQDSNGHLRDSEAVFWECIDALGNVKNSTERDVIAMQLFGKSAKELNPLIEAGSDEWKKYCAEAEEAGLILSEDGVGALGSFNDSLQRIDATMDAAQKQIFSALAPAFEEVATMVMNASQKFTTWIQTDEAKGYLSQLADTVSKLAEKFLSNLGPAVDGAIGLFGKVADVITFASDHFDEIVVAVETFIAVLATLKTGMAVLSIAQFFTNPLSGAIVAVTAVIAAITLLVTHFDDLKTVASNVLNGIKSAWNSVVSFFSGIVTGIANAFSSIGDKISNFFKSALDKVKSIWNAITSWFTSIVTGVVNAFNKIPSSISTFFQTAINNVKNVWTAITSWFSSIVSSVVNTFTNIPSSISNFFQNALNSVKNVWNTVTSWFSSIASSVANAFTSIPSKISSFFSNAWNSVKSAWNSATSWFTSISSNVANAFTSIPTKIKTFFTNAWNNVKTAWGNVTSFFSGIPSKIYQVFTSLPSQFTSIGKNIVQGLWNGINSMVSWISGKVKGFTDSVVGSFKNFFGIKSPSRVMRDEVGKYLGMGVGEGIMDEADYVQKSFDSLMPDFDVMGINGNASGMSGSGITGMGGYTININIDGARYSDEKSLAQAISDELQFMLDRRKAVFA